MTPARPVPRQDCRVWGTRCLLTSLLVSSNAVPLKYQNASFQASNSLIVERLRSRLQSPPNLIDAHTGHAKESHPLPTINSVARSLWYLCSARNICAYCICAWVSAPKYIEPLIATWTFKDQGPCSLGRSTDSCEELVWQKQPIRLNSQQRQILPYLVLATRLEIARSLVWSWSTFIVVGLTGSAGSAGAYRPSFILSGTSAPILDASTPSSAAWAAMLALICSLSAAVNVTSSSLMSFMRRSETATRCIIS